MTPLLFDIHLKYLNHHCAACCTTTHVSCFSYFFFFFIFWWAFCFTAIFGRSVWMVIWIVYSRTIWADMALCLHLNVVCLFLLPLFYSCRGYHASRHDSAVARCWLIICLALVDYIYQFGSDGNRNPIAYIMGLWSTIVNPVRAISLNIHVSMGLLVLFVLFYFFYQSFG